MATTRAYKIGQTVNLRAKVSKPGTKTPTDPSTVTLVDLTLGGVSVISDTPFVRQQEGNYLLTIGTDALVPGVYKAIVRVEGGADKVWLGTDEFVLEAI